jgi:NADPH:quinone reductase-like Zn-dependent oxidoreductase
MILGCEVVGKLVELGTQGEKHGYKVGDTVIALNKEKYGGLAEKCLAEVGVRIFRTLDAPVHACILNDNIVGDLLRTYGSYLL